VAHAEEVHVAVARKVSVQPGARAVRGAVADGARLVRKRIVRTARPGMLAGPCLAPGRATTPESSRNG